METNEFRIAQGPQYDAVLKLISKSGISLKDINGRTIICTASRAHYGQCSHWVLSVEGTPPRGTIVFDTNRYSPGVAFLLVQDSCKRLTGKSYDVVDAFVGEFLEGRECE